MASHLPFLAAEKIVSLFRGVEDLSTDSLRDLIRKNERTRECFAELKRRNEDMRAGRALASAINTFANGESQ